MTQLDHAKRSKGVGGSDAGYLIQPRFGRTPYAIWLEKTGQAEREEITSEAAYWGTRNEANVADWYSEQTGRKVRRQPPIVSKTHPFMLGNVDRQIVGDPRGPGILEVKTAGEFRGFTNESELPAGYYAQLQHYLAVTGYQWGAFAVLVGGNKGYKFEVERNDEYIARLINIEAEFWHCVETMTAPQLCAEDFEPARERYREAEDIEIPLGDDWRGEIEALAAVMAMKRGAEEEEKRIKARLMVAMGAASVATLDGRPVVTWRNAKPTTKEVIDADLLRTTFPDVAAQVISVVTTPGARSMRVLAKKEKGDA